MAIKKYYDSDCNLGVLDGKTVAVIGFGSQGHAHSENLAESGVNVVVGLRKGSAHWAKASEFAATHENFKVMEVEEAAKAGDVVMMLVPDELCADIYNKQVAPYMTEGKALAFAHGFNIHFHDLEVLVRCCELRSLLPVSGTLAQADDDVDAALGQVFGVCMALTAKADDRDGLAVQHAEVAVGIVVFLDSHSSCSPFYFSVVANNKRSVFFRSPGSGKNIQVRSGQWVPGRGSWAARTSCGGFCICWCIPPRSSAVTPVRHCSRIS